MQSVQVLLRASLITLSLSLPLGLTGCAHTSSVHNVQNAPIYQNHGPLTLQQVRDKIAKALAAKRWGIEDESQGWIVARVTTGGHWAKVRITFDTKTYTIIHFESSPGLKWDGERIHRRYNNWINLLDGQIRKQLSMPPSNTTTDSAPDEPAATPTPESATTPAEDAPEADVEEPTAPAGPPSDGPAPDPSWDNPSAP